MLLHLGAWRSGVPRAGGGVARGRGRRPMSAWCGRSCWRPSSSTATRCSRHRQSTVHGPTDWLRCGSSMPCSMRRSRKRRSRRLFISPWPGACSFSAARRLALPGCPRRKVRSRSCGRRSCWNSASASALQQRAVVVAGGEVQERARDRGGREAAVAGGVARAQVAADEDRQPLGLRMVSRHRELDHRGRGRNDAPAPGRRPVTQQGPVARGQQGGDEVPLLGEQFGRHRRVHAPMDAVQPAARRRRDRSMSD